MLPIGQFLGILPADYSFLGIFIALFRERLDGHPEFSHFVTGFEFIRFRAIQRLR